MAELVADRFGEQAVARSVDPLLGGVYAGSAATIGLRAGAPSVAAALDRGAASLTDAVRRGLPPAGGGPVFGALDGGYQVLIDELVRRGRPQWVQAAVTAAGTAAGTLHDDTGGQLARRRGDPGRPGPAAGAPRGGPGPAQRRRREQDRQRVVGGGGARGAGRNRVSAELRRAGGQRGAVARQGDHVVVAQVGRAGDEAQLLRLSFGRFGEDLASTASDDELLAWALDDLAAVFGLAVDPVEVRVQRWIDAMPQYGPGHADLVARGAGRPAAGAGRGRQLPGRHRRAGVHRGGRARGRDPASGSGTIGLMAKLDYDALNSTIRYLMFSVFSVRPGELGEQRDAVIDDASRFFKQQEERGVVVRGLYDVAGLRADADFMIWTHAERVEALQATYADFRRTTTLGRACSPVWSSVALHRPAEFNKSHIPAFLAGEEPGNYICVYPFVRSYEWYLLPDEERRRMLAEHGMAAREYKDVRANTVPAFALGDYEWILAFEAPELDRIVDLMRELRATDARRHTREETPFFTGPRVPVEQLVNSLP